MGSSTIIRFGWWWWDVLPVDHAVLSHRRTQFNFAIMRPINEKEPQNRQSVVYVGCVCAHLSFCQFLYQITAYSSCNYCHTSYTVGCVCAHLSFCQFHFQISLRSSSLVTGSPGRKKAYYDRRRVEQTSFASHSMLLLTIAMRHGDLIGWIQAISGGRRVRQCRCLLRRPRHPGIQNAVPKLVSSSSYYMQIRVNCSSGEK
ncbi:hypothetical protein Nepgr_006304 [Nepenthes gracilis]|uniref:Uncharacterized protein n=1 Tax=Nepenthes gracilis TaxID=150966 RepID=A0AAD3S4W8_NEPGR|nr:hypothetical protein Nepgr_006304 [Nepenthes gracilis]